MVAFGESGPASMGLIDNLVATIDVMQQRIEQLENQVRN